MTVTELRRTNAGASVYDTRPDCPAPFHDSYSATRRVGCTCPAARRARARYLKRQQHGYLEPAYIDATGTRRRMQALNAIGYPIRELGQMLGWAGNPGTLLWSDRQVHRVTATRVTDLYERLSGTPGPSQRSRQAAARAGYAPPHAWEYVDIDDPEATPDLGTSEDDIVDEEAIKRVVAGDMPFKALRDREKIEFFRGPAAGWAYTPTMERLHMSASTVKKWRALAEDVEQVAA